MKDKDMIPVTFPSAPFGQLGLDPTITDPLGSYTGVPAEFDDVPVQVADDL